MDRYSGEPSLAELLADPIVRQVMRADGCDMSCLTALIDKAAENVTPDAPGFGQPERR